MTFFHLISVHFIAVFYAAHSLELTASPKIIEPGETKSLLLNCSFHFNNLMNMKWINCMILSHAFDGNYSEYKDLASICINDGLVNLINKEAEASGVIGYSSESYLTFQWNLPYFHMAGVYKCDVNGIDSSWRLLTLSTNVNVVVSELSLRSVSEQLRVLRMKDVQKDKMIEAMQLAVSNLVPKNASSSQIHSCVVTETCTELQARLDNITKQINRVNKSRSDRLTALRSNYIESDLYDGSRYYLTKTLGRNFDMRSAELTCEWYGGHLAEIDNDDEMNFVRGFVKQYYSYIWISGTDESNENVWLSSFSNKTLRYLNWGGYSNTNLGDYDCIYLHQSHAWYMHPYLCKRDTVDSGFAYLCEISQ